MTWKPPTYDLDIANSIFFHLEFTLFIHQEHFNSCHLYVKQKICQQSQVQY